MTYGFSKTCSVVLYYEYSFPIIYILQRNMIIYYFQSIHATFIISSIYILKKRKSLFSLNALLLRTRNQITAILRLFDKALETMQY